MAFNGVFCVKIGECFAIRIWYSFFVNFEPYFDIFPHICNDVTKSVTSHAKNKIIFAAVLECVEHIVSYACLIVPKLQEQVMISKIEQ